MEASLNRQVVIKILPPEHSSAVSAARFKQEMELAASLQHPHILPVLGAGAQEGLLYYLMPYVAGESLRGRLSREGPLPVPEAVRFLVEITDALAFAHGKGVIHRDIKPENILLEGKHAVLADFGIARALLEAQNEERLTVSGMSVGTPGYMAPEQLVGDSVDARADLYSVAIVGYEILSGAPPFSGPSAQAILAAHLTTPPLPLHEICSEVPESVSAVIARALSKEPSDRFATAEELAEALSRSVVTPSEATPAQLAPGLQRRRFRQRLALALALLIIVIGAGVLAVRRGRSLAVDRALLERLAPMVEEENLDAVAQVLTEAGSDIDKGALAPIRSRVAGFLSVSSTPSGAEVTVTRVSPIETFGDHPTDSLGTTPLGPRALVAGEYLLCFHLSEADSLLRVVTLGAGDSVEVASVLPSIDDTRAGYVPVPAGPSVVGSVVDAFLMGQTEVSNAEYALFVAAGGYRNMAFWPAAMTIGGQTLSREMAMALLVDRTGLPGPRSWSSGMPPEGKQDHPVTDVSWYEAVAYARWTGGELPTLSQWYRAALADGSAPYPWGRDGGSVEVRANFGFAGTTPVGTHPLGVSPFGIHDMAGNVREWIADEAPGLGRRLVVGGSWRDAAYMFERSHLEGFDPGTAGVFMGFRVVKPASPQIP
jgi:formylglycine-generating enzyme required for sulfatase activity